MGILPLVLPMNGLYRHETKCRGYISIAFFIFEIVGPITYQVV